jgi:DNA-binding NarL/FixJ family response regulator
VWLDPGIAEKMLHKLTGLDKVQVVGKTPSISESRHLQKPTTALSPEFTEDEMKILRAIVHGLSNKEIAERLNSSPQFVTDKIRVILRKLQNYEMAKTRVQSENSS